MDLPLLAVTALGFVGVYLMMPRGKVTRARIGGLVGALALGGFFLLLVRGLAGAGVVGGGGGGGPSVYFYVFAGVMIASAVGVICHPKPVYAALYFVLVTLAGAGLFVLLLAEFMAIVLIIVYAGAILVTYVFVIMLASQGSAGKRTAEYDRVASEPFAAVLVSFILLGTVLQVLWPVRGGKMVDIARPGGADAMMVASLAGGHEGGGTMLAGAGAAGGATQRYVPGNTQVLGVSLYGNYTYSLELAGVLLTVALVGAVAMARKNAGEGRDAAGSGGVPEE